MEIKKYESGYEQDLVDLWVQCGLVVPQNSAQGDIGSKMDFQPDLLFTGFLEGTLVASVMAGYEGHRGWVNYLAVSPQYQRKGFGRAMMQHAEAELTKLGCPKINLQVRGGNDSVIKFYDRIGYAIEDRVSMGKRLT
ncbi:MAG: GNAT family acetyltransferase [Chloroflexi bacterium]|jgi:ribosomal protein S18 acetylase RimI-like enzyme|nr:GNAT family acetyltransferase [Chloroflexota bacterium]MBT7080378.1 GNAT family acetyltransferase [Chloroflexota bacterium]MBT7289452.1 GNAT family acetyltransferase [Chloroflexota bacterium]